MRVWGAKPCKWEKVCLEKVKVRSQWSEPRYSGTCWRLQGKGEAGLRPAGEGSS